MTTAAERVPKHDPLAADLTSAGAGIKLDEWDRFIPPRRPIVPHIRIGKRLINILWAALPIALGLIIPIAIAQGLRNIPVVEAFIRRYRRRRAAPRSRLSGVAARAAALEHVLRVLRHAR